jgi:hypothetical protein
MPVVARFAGFEIVMYFRDHNPPHVHVVSPDDHALVDIQAAEIFRGALQAKFRREALEWIEENSAKLMALWTENQR